MGTLRTLFAISVVLVHANAHALVGGRNAVQLFYIISGFLISYVLIEANAYPNLKDFYLNRYLRLYPIYLFVASVTLIAEFVVNNHGFLDVYAKAPLSADSLLALSNLLMFGQDWVMFTGVSEDKLRLVVDFTRSDVPLHNGLLVPQAWTLGVELSFYLIAPFVLRNRRVLCCLLATSLFIRLYLVTAGIGLHDPWTYRFFPAELAFFLLGALAHQILLPLYRRALKNNMRLFSTAATCSLIAVALFYPAIPLNEFLKSTILFAFFLTLIPFTFLFQNTSKLDRRIGELSYPIYVGHMLVLMTVSFIGKAVGTNSQLLLTTAGLSLTLLFAVFLNIAIGRPVERSRQHFRKPAAKLEASTSNDYRPTCSVTA